MSDVSVLLAADSAVREFPFDPRVQSQSTVRLLVQHEGSSLLELFLRLARLRPEEILYADASGGSWTRRRLCAAAMRLSRSFAQAPGQVGALCMRQGPHWVAAYFGLLLAEKHPLLLDPSIERPEAEPIIGALRPTLWVMQTEKVGPLKTPGEPGVTILSSDDISALLTQLPLKNRWLALRRLETCARAQEGHCPALTLATRGAADRRKYVTLTNMQLLGNFRDCAGICRLREGDRILSDIPLWHAFGFLVGIVLPVCTGLGCFLADPSEKASTKLDAMAYSNCNLAAAYPASWETLLESDPSPSGVRALNALRLVFLGAEELPAGFVRLARIHCPQTRFLQVYGLSEATAIVSSIREHDQGNQGVGRVLPSFRYVLLDETLSKRVTPGTPGRLLLRGPCVNYRYADGSQGALRRFEGQNWLDTEDLLRETPDGNLVFVRRL